MLKEYINQKKAPEDQARYAENKVKLLSEVAGKIGVNLESDEQAQKIILDVNNALEKISLFS